jgi:tRNA pseudouridine55 synthase
LKRSASIATPDLTGILNINKPRGWTSHDVVARIRSLAGQKRVGHAGTLDPLAEGVLPVLLGRATRLADYIQSGRKTYVATIQLGSATETDDTEGAITSRATLPILSEAVIEGTLSRFRGEILQTPPKYSALKLDGRRAYALARRGAEVELAPRPVTIDDLRLLDHTDALLSLEVTCSKGTYIRALARDIAVALGTVGHMASLLRTRVGPFVLSDALGLDHIAARGVAHALQPADRALPEAPTFCLDSTAAAKFANGQPLHAAGLRADCVWVYDPLGRLIGLGSAHGDLLRPRFAL